MMFSNGWFVAWLIIIVVIGIGATAFMTYAMESSLMGWICIFATLLAVLLYMLIFYLLLR